MRRLKTLLTVAFLTVASAAHATTFTFDNFPFLGSDALTTPGRQVVGGEASISFNTAADVFALGSFLDVGSTVDFFNGQFNNIPNTGVNVIVLQTLDDDANTGTPFAAGNAATLIANQITTPGAGFFIYFNQGLNLPRLVFSPDLNDPASDLKILFRMTNLLGNTGSLATFTAANFAIVPQAEVPEPSTLVLTGMGALAFARSVRRRKARR